MLFINFYRTFSLLTSFLPSVFLFPLSPPLFSFLSYHLSASLTSFYASFLSVRTFFQSLSVHFSPFSPSSSHFIFLFFFFLPFPALCSLPLLLSFFFVLTSYLSLALTLTAFRSFSVSPFFFFLSLLCLPELAFLFRLQTFFFLLFIFFFLSYIPSFRFPSLSLPFGGTRMFLPLGSSLGAGQTQEHLRRTLASLCLS